MKVAYILLYFPQLTETFVAEEIRSIRDRDVDVHISSLLSPRAGPVQPVSQQLLPYVSYAPRLLAPLTWRAQLHFLLKSSRLYLGLLATFLCQPYPRHPLSLFVKRVVVFLKAVSVAYCLKDTEIDLLHSHFAWLSGAATWICARLLNKPFTVTMHAYDIYSYKNDLLYLISREATQLIAISEFNKAQVAALGTRAAEAISVIHCGIDPAKLDAPQKRPMKRSSGGPLRVLSVGSLVTKKGHHVLIAACKLLQQRGLEFTCTIIGGGPNENALRQQIQADGLQHQVELLGTCPHPAIIEAYHRHDLFVLASVVAADGDRDGIPVVLMEAGQVGLPLISTRVSGIPELIRHKQTGWLVPPGDAAALAEAITALAADPALRACLGRNARALVEAQFTIQSSTAQLAALFLKTIRHWEEMTQ